MSNLNNDFYEKGINLHINSWEKHWDNAEIVIYGDKYAQKSVNYALYHLISSGEFSGNFTSIPARNLSGESYQGHIFWDTEIYMLPFYIFTEPDVARSLLMYRYNALDGAKINAIEQDFEGASFAWESTDSGLEMAPTEAISPFGHVINIFTSEYEHHISPDIAYAVWQYWTVTQDKDFMLDYGSEIIFETARFCKSLLSQGEDGLYHIYEVIGPDEYHELIHDNAYTNIMVRYNLEIAVKLFEWLKKNHKSSLENLKNKISLVEAEIKNWTEIKDKIFISNISDKNIYEQFNGFFDLEYIDVKSYENRTAPMDVILGREKTKKSQVIKQPDVLMFLFLLANQFPQDVIRANYDYYEPRTGHGSSLSPGIHSLLAARLDKSEEAYHYFKQSTEVDLYNGMGNASGGIHMANMGSIWMAVVMGFAGMYICDRGLIFDPHLPENWEKLEFPIIWRSQRVSVTLKKEEMVFDIKGDQKVNISAGFNNWKELKPNKRYLASKLEKWCWK
jgi:kojibiose phosphorylase